MSVEGEERAGRADEGSPAAGRPVAAAGSQAAAVAAPEHRRREGRRSFWLTMAFLAPALIVLGALVLYPILYSVWRSLYDQSGTRFLGVGNYRSMFLDHNTLVAIRNNALWLIVPLVVVAIGLVMAVLAERIRWSTAFKVVVFMPMAVSALSAGVTWRLMYEQDPNQGAVNAAVNGVVSLVHPPGNYPGARPSAGTPLRPEAGNLVLTKPVQTGRATTMGLVAIPPDEVPKAAVQAAPPPTVSDGIGGTVWLDFKFGGGGKKGVVDQGEKGLPGVRVEAVRDGRVAGSATTETNGTFRIAGLPTGSYQMRLASSSFRAGWAGLAWLGPSLITPAVMIAYVWIWAGFAVVVIGAGLAAIPRDVLEAARVDGATEWNVFRRVTVPLLMPVLLVVLVTLIINVLKIFDLIYVIAPGSSQQSANVLALQMFRVSFGGGNDQGLGSAIAIFLFVLVLPAMLFNFRRFRAEQ